MRRFVGRCRLSEARVASDLSRQFAKDAGDRGSDASVEVSIACLFAMQPGESELQARSVLFVPIGICVWVQRRESTGLV